MADSDDDYDTSARRRGHSRNKFRKEREELTNNGDAMNAGLELNGADSFNQRRKEKFSSFKDEERREHRISRDHRHHHPSDSRLPPR
jgi:hypothetical protein